LEFLEKERFCEALESFNSFSSNTQEPFRFLVDLAVTNLVESRDMETKESGLVRELLIKAEKTQHTTCV